MTEAKHPERGDQEAQPSQALSESDAAIARVLEDLIDTLIGRGVIQFTDLPEAAQGKLLWRRKTAPSSRIHCNCCRMMVTQACFKQQCGSRESTFQCQIVRCSMIR